MFFFSNYYVTNMKKITHEYSIKIDFFCLFKFVHERISEEIYECFELRD
jgi:hypothetical protein